MSKTHQEYQENGFIEDQREFFDKLITQDWDTYVNPIWDKARQFEVHQILQLVRDSPKRVLDVGCGCGYHDQVFADSGVEQVVGIDNSPRSIEQAERHYPHKKVQRVVADIFQPSQVVQYWGKFDLVASFQVIEHLKNPLAFLAACAACTRDGGYVIVVTPHRKRLVNRLRSLLGKGPSLSDPMHFTEYTVAELTELAVKSGMQYATRFAHSVSLPYIKIPNSVWIGHVLPSLADYIGVLFKKPA